MLCLDHPRRAIFRSDGNAITRAATIPLDNVGEIVLWLEFIGRDWKCLKPDDLKKPVRLAELLMALGANLNPVHDDIAMITPIRLAPGMCSTHQRERQRDGAPRSTSRTHSFSLTPIWQQITRTAY